MKLKKIRRVSLKFTTPVVFRAFQGLVNDGIFDKIFEASVMKLFQEKLVDCTILHGDGTNHAAKKGGDNLGFNAHKRIKGDKVVVVCERNVNVIAPFIEATGNRNEVILLNPCLKRMKAMADKVGLKLDGIIMSLDSIHNSKSNRKAIFNRNMIPNSKLRQCDLNREGRKQLYNPDIFQERFRRIERLFVWEDKFNR